MKLGCSSSAYAEAFRAGRIDLRDWLRACAEDMELDGIELAAEHFATTDPTYLRDIKKLCTDLQLTIAGIALDNDFGDERRRTADIAEVRRWCEIAVYLGAPAVRVFAGRVPAAYAEPEPGRIVGLFRKVFGQPVPDKRRLWSDATAALRQCANYAAERGVVLALQNRRDEGIVGSGQQLAQCLHDVGSSWLRICLDPADLRDPAGIEIALPRVVQARARLREVHEDGSDLLVHWPELLRILKLGRYRGFVLIDYAGPEHPERVVPLAARYLRSVLHVLERQQLLHSPGENGTGTHEEAEEILVEAAPVS